MAEQRLISASKRMYGGVLLLLVLLLIGIPGPAQAQDTQVK